MTFTFPENVDAGKVHFKDVAVISKARTYAVPIKQYCAPPLVEFKLFPVIVTIEDPSLGPKGGLVPLPPLTPVVEDPMDGTGSEVVVNPMEVKAEVVPSVLATARTLQPGRWAGRVHVNCRNSL